jgi:hypothetical protein
MDAGHVLIGMGLFFLILWTLALVGRYYQRRRRERQETGHARH